jgi:hypothetical protein
MINLNKGRSSNKRVIKIMGIKFCMLKRIRVHNLNKTREAQNKNSQILNSPKRNLHKQNQMMEKETKGDKTIEINIIGKITEKKNNKTKIPKRKKSIIF